MKKPTKSKIQYPVSKEDYNDWLSKGEGNSLQSYAKNVYEKKGGIDKYHERNKNLDYNGNPIYVPFKSKYHTKEKPKAIKKALTTAEESEDLEKFGNKMYKGEQKVTPHRIGAMTKRIKKDEGIK